MVQKRSVSSIFGHKPDSRSILSDHRVVGDTLVGIEVELERVSNLEMIQEEAIFWDLKEDGSLRDRGVEFVLNQPLGGKDIIRSLNELEQLVDMMKEPPYTSESTSVHVHVDIRDLDEDQYINLLILYVIFERSLFRVCGPDRYINTFCRSVCETFGLVDMVANMSINRETIPMMIDSLHRNKYMAVNLGTTQSFGSVEFRGHRGEWRKSVLLPWINLLLSLKEYAKGEIDWDTALMNISAKGYPEFAQLVFGDHFKTIDGPNLVQDMMEGVRDAQDIIYADKLASVKGQMKVVYDDEGTLVLPDHFNAYLKKKGG